MEYESQLYLHFIFYYIHVFLILFYIYVCIFNSLLLDFFPHVDPRYKTIGCC